MANLKFLVQAAVGAVILAASSAAIAQPVPVNVTQVPSWLSGVEGMPNFDSATARLYPPAGGTVMLYDGDTLVGWFMQPGFVNLVPNHIYGIAVMSGTTMQFNSGLLVRKGVTDVSFADGGYPQIQYYPSPAALYGYGHYGRPAYGYDGYGYGYNDGYGYDGYGRSPYGRDPYGYPPAPVVHHPAAPPPPPHPPVHVVVNDDTLSNQDVARVMVDMRDDATDGKRLTEMKRGLGQAKLRASQAAKLMQAFTTQRGRNVAFVVLKSRLVDPQNTRVLEAARDAALPTVQVRPQITVRH